MSLHKILSITYVALTTMGIILLLDMLIEGVWLRRKPGLIAAACATMMGVITVALLCAVVIDAWHRP